MIQTTLLLLLFIVTSYKPRHVSKGLAGGFQAKTQYLRIFPTAEEKIKVTIDYIGLAAKCYLRG